jgi:hypothetical protein
LRGAEIPPDEFAVIPFPIEHPEELPNYLPVTVPILTTVYDEWNREKVRILQRVGYEVIIMWEREEKVVTGSEVRKLLLSGSDELAGLVPETVLSQLKEFDVAARLRALTESRPTGE